MGLDRFGEAYRLRLLASAGSIAALFMASIARRKCSKGGR